MKNAQHHWSNHCSPPMLGAQTTDPAGAGSAVRELLISTLAAASKSKCCESESQQRQRAGLRDSAPRPALVKAAAARDIFTAATRHDVTRAKTGDGVLNQRHLLAADKSRPQASVRLPSLLMRSCARTFPANVGPLRVAALPTVQ
jgi:hypothetical protein